MLSKRSILLQAAILIVLTWQTFYIILDSLNDYVGMSSSVYYMISDLFHFVSLIWALYLLKQIRTDREYWRYQMTWLNIGYVLLGFVFLNLVTFFTNIFFPMTANGEGLIEAVAAPTILEQLIFPIMLLVIAPIREELIHRGLVWILSERLIKGRLSFLISSVTFACMHLPYYDFRVTDFIKYFLQGLVFGWVYQKSNSIYWAIIIHMVWNGFIFFMAGL